ncbi:MAG TPA: hypothetical protein VN759_03695, partial [Pseudolysinimonas sp.]|nr:hypothetical protein [Pseudolysinimonas sp.]
DGEAGKKLSAAEREAAVRSTRRFDLRRIMGGLFVVYGVIVTIVGLVDLGGDKETKLTGGIQINIWVGIGMLVLGGLFFLWDRLAPVSEEDIVHNLEREDEEKHEGEGH